MKDSSASLRKLLCLFLCFLCYHVFAKDGKSTFFPQRFQSLKYRHDRFSVSLGTSFCRLTSKGSGAYNLLALGKSSWDESTGISAAIFTQFRPFPFRYDFKIGYGLKYHQLSATGEYDQLFSNGLEEIYHFNFKFSTIELPLYAKYQWTKNNIGVSLSLGASLAIFLTKSDRLHYIENYKGVQKRNETSGAVYLNRATGDGLMSSSFNAFSSMSLDFPLLEKQIIFIEATYCPYANIANSSQVSLYPTFTDIHVGIRF